MSERRVQCDITLKEIADDLHSSRVVIYRVIKKLRKQGFLDQKRNKIFLIKI